MQNSTEVIEAKPMAVSLNSNARGEEVPTKASLQNVSTRTLVGLLLEFESGRDEISAARATQVEFDIMRKLANFARMPQGLETIINMYTELGSENTDIARRMKKCIESYISRLHPDMYIKFRAIYMQAGSESRMDGSTLMRNTEPGFRLPDGTVVDVSDAVAFMMRNIKH